MVRLAHSGDLRSRQHGVLMHQLLFTFLLLSVLIHFHKQLCSFMFEILSPRARVVVVQKSERESERDGEGGG